MKRPAAPPAPRSSTCRCLLPRQEKAELPLLFNEFCTTWGTPSEENIGRILETIKDRGFDYFIIDAGWYADPVKGWQRNMGDWRVFELKEPLTITVPVRMKGRIADSFGAEGHGAVLDEKGLTLSFHRSFDAAAFYLAAENAAAP